MNEDVKTNKVQRPKFQSLTVNCSSLMATLWLTVRENGNFKQKISYPITNATHARDDDQIHAHKYFW